MLKSILTPALLTLALSGAAFAASPAAQLSNDAQLARSAGVEAGAYTSAELQAITDARRENDARKLAFYLSGENRTAQGAVDASEQLARSAGVAPGAYTAAELVQIIDAKRDNDLTRLSFYLTGANRKAPADAATVSPGEAQLAALARLNPAEHTLAELSAANTNISD